MNGAVAAVSASRASRWPRICPAVCCSSSRAARSSGDSSGFMAVPAGVRFSAVNFDFALDRSTAPAPPPNTGPTCSAPYAACPNRSRPSGESGSRPACTSSRICCKTSTGNSSATPRTAPRPEAATNDRPAVLTNSSRAAFLASAVTVVLSTSVTVAGLNSLDTKFLPSANAPPAASSAVCPAAATAAFVRFSSNGTFFPSASSACATALDPKNCGYIVAAAPPIPPITAPATLPTPGTTEPIAPPPKAPTRAPANIVPNCGKFSATAPGTCDINSPAPASTPLTPPPAVSYAFLVSSHPFVRPFSLAMRSCSANPACAALVASSDEPNIALTPVSVDDASCFAPPMKRLPSVASFSAVMGVFCASNAASSIRLDSSCLAAQRPAADIGSGVSFSACNLGRILVSIAFLISASDISAGKFTGPKPSMLIVCMVCFIQVFPLLDYTYARRFLQQVYWHYSTSPQPASSALPCRIYACHRVPWLCLLLDPV